jgi:hypothetical protein
MLDRLDNPANREGTKRITRVLDPLDLQPKIGQSGQNLVERCQGFQVIFEPGKGEFHGFSLLLTGLPASAGALHNGIRSGPEVPA